MSQYYYYDGANTIGPHSAHELRQLLKEALINSETLVFRNGNKDWQPASSYVELTTTPETLRAGPKPVTAENNAIAGEEAQTLAASTQPAETAEDDADDDNENDKGLSKYQIIRSIRSELDRLWECQRESIIAGIKNEDIPDEYAKTRKQAREIKANIENLAYDYFRKSNVLRDWIRELTWENDNYKSGRADVTRKLVGESCQERYTNAVLWLERSGLIDVEGCYCFRNADKTYRYIGKAQSQSIGQRLKQWEKASFWIESSHLRIVIPKFKSQTTKLERLLIMLHQPLENEKSGDKGGNNPADKVIQMIQKEIQDLLVDG